MSNVIVWRQSPIVNSNLKAKYHLFKARECTFCTLTHVPQFRKKFDDQGKKFREKYVEVSEKNVDGRCL